MTAPVTATARSAPSSCPCVAFFPSTRATTHVPLATTIEVLHGTVLENVVDRRNPPALVRMIATPGRGDLVPCRAAGVDPVCGGRATCAIGTGARPLTTGPPA